MQTTDTPAAGSSERDAASDPCAAIRAHLEARRRDVLRQLAQYPPPITACDAQFNHLLEQRDGLADWLRRLDMTAAGDAGRRALALDAFLTDCPYLDVDARERPRGDPDR